MLAYDLPDRGGGFTTTLGGQSCEAHVFRRALFPLTPGRYVIPPARLTYAIPQSPSFFSREENYTLRSEGVTLVSIDPPTRGRPADWAGAVGAWRTSARVDTVRPRAGDPFVVTLRIEGQGNVTLLPRPALTVAWGTVVPADERVRLDSTPTALRGSKEFDWLLTSSVAGPQRVPSIRFSWFNPGTRQYEVALTAPLVVRVSAGDVVATAPVPLMADAPPIAELRTALGDEEPLPLGDALWLRAVLVAAPLAAFGAWLVRRPRRLPRSPTPVERLRAMQRAGASPASPADVRRSLLDGLLTRTGLRAAALAQPGAWSRALRLHGVSDAGAAEVEEFMDELDAGAFGERRVALRDAPARAIALLARVHQEARMVVLMLACAASAVITNGRVARAQSTDAHAAREAFAQGATAYAGADYLRSERYFQDAAHAAPRASEAWANAGFAAWAAYDTAGAVVGWQRALRLNPTARGIRSRLALARAPQDVGLAHVMALPRRLPTMVALALWCAGWALVARRCWRRQRALPLAVTTVLVAGTLGVFARTFENRLEGRNLVVISDPAALRPVPALGAQGGVVPLTGEVARVVARQGVWVHVWLDGGREGWIASERTAALGRD